MEGHAELYDRLLQALGTTNSACHIVSFTKEKYRRRGCFVVAFDLEEMGHSDFSGMNLNGAMVTLSAKNVCCANEQNTLATKAYITTNYDCILEISQFGATRHQ